MLILSSLSKIQVDQFDRFFFGHWFPSGCGVIMGIVVSHQFNGIACRDIMQFHEVRDFWVGFDLPCDFHSLSPGVVSWSSSLSPFSGVPSMLGQVTSLLVADEALLVSDVLCSFVWRKIDLVYVHCIGIRLGGLVSRQDVAVSSSSEFSKSHYISVEFSSLIKPLFPLPTSLSIREGSGSHHDGELLGYSSL